MRMLDSDILIDVLRQFAPAENWLNNLTEIPGLSGLVVMELIGGCNNKSDLRHVQRLTGLFPVVWPTEADCRRAFADFAQFRLSHNLGLLDSLIAATAIGQGAMLCTFNVKHFQMLPGLTLEQPYMR